MLVAYLRIRGLAFTHIANETGGSPEALRRAIRVKRQGVSKGFPDYLVIAGGHLLAIELKRQKGSHISQEQRDWIDLLNGVDNIQAFICKGAQEAIDIVEKYLPAGRSTGESAFEDPF